jgi:hypothetical protein
MPGIKGSPLKGKLMTPFSPAEFHLDDSKQQREHKQYSSGQNWSVKVEDTSEQVKVDSKGKNFLYREDMDTSSRDNRRTHNRSNSVSRSSRSSRSSNGYDNSGSDGSSTGSSSYTESSSSESEVDELEAARQARAVTERERELALFKTKFNL